jgi:hypothetical protein
MFKHHPHNFCGFIDTNIWEAFGNLCFSKCKFDYFCNFFLSQKWKKKNQKKKTISLERNSGNSSHISVDQISN